MIGVWPSVPGSPDNLIDQPTSIGDRSLEPRERSADPDADSVVDVGAALAGGIRPVALCTGKVDPRTMPVVAEKNVPVYPDFWTFVKTLK